MKKVFFIVVLFTAFLSNAGEPPIKYVTPENCKTIIQNADTGEVIEVDGAKVVKLNKDRHYFINVIEHKTKSVTMLEKNKDSELIIDLFF